MGLAIKKYTLKHQCAVEAKVLHQRLERSSESSWYHPEIATSAGYNNNYLEKINVIIGVLHRKKIQTRQPMIWVNYPQILIACLKVIIDQRPAQTMEHMVHIF